MIFASPRYTRVQQSRAYDPFDCEWEDAFDAISELSRLRPNWDGEGADPVRSQLIRTAEAWLSRVRTVGVIDGAIPPGAIYPTAGGTIMLEWHHAGGATTSAHIRKPGLVEIVAHEGGEKPQFVSVDVELECNQSPVPRSGRDEPGDGEFALAE